MSDLNYQIFVKHHKLLHRLMYCCIYALGITMYIFKFWQIKTSIWMSAFFLGAFFFGIADEALSHLNFFDSARFRFGFKYFELLVYGPIIAKLSDEPLTYCTGMIFIAILCMEFATYDSDYDRTSIAFRKILIGVLFFINYSVSVAGKHEKYFILFFFVCMIVVLVIYFVVDWLAGQCFEFDKKRNELLIEISAADKANSKLLEYHERVKAVNEEINYQKIELRQAYKEMEVINRDIEAQADVLKYIVSTFDIQKCIEVITNSVVDVRKASICAIYIEQNAYRNKQPVSVVKTDYASVERRLKKEIEKIYFEFIENNKTPVLYDRDSVSQFQFIGDVNISSLAIFPFIDGRKRYGFMMVGSKKEDYFKRGVGMFESDIVGLTLAIKNSKTYYKMQHIAQHDGLTDIYNRPYFNELFTAACKHANRKNQPIAVALYDIDHFKLVNDTYGHPAGDEVIKMVAKAGEAIAEKYKGFACRYGGEEFLVVLPGYTAESALPVFEELHEMIKSKQVRYKDVSISVDVSIGVSAFPSTCDNTDILINRADKAMYFGKKNGRGRLIVDNGAYE